MAEFSRINGKYVLNAVEDAPDFRDFRYQPALIPLQNEVTPPDDLNIRDQGGEGACTGFGLAAAIDLQLGERGDDRTVSTRMLYEMAKQFDEWSGEAYEGSSCRGAVKGWYGMGVCDDTLAPYSPGHANWQLTIDQAKDARKTSLGAYYRVDKKISDYHAALNEVGALYVSAMVTTGWQNRSVGGGEIALSDEILGGHAFTIVGYNGRGFWIQNSWGESWGKDGTALWLYEDWLEHGRDAWVVRLAVSTPQIWHLRPNETDSSRSEERDAKPAPRRAEILGHFVHIDDGNFDTQGKFGTDLDSIKKTASFLAGSDDYDHLLFYAHGGLNDINASARRVAAMKEVWKANRVYPFHFMYDTGLLEEIKDIVFGHDEEVEERAAGFTDWTDKLIEEATRKVGRAIWREMKFGATSPFTDDGAGTQTVGAFLDEFEADGAKLKSVHLAGHSTGAILLANLLLALGDEPRAPRIKTCSLMAPACTHDLFNDAYRPLLASGLDGLRIDRMKIYNLDDKLELDDTVTPAYRKSLLYLVSRAFEEEPPERILGLQKYRNRLGRLPGGNKLRFEVSNGSSRENPRTTSTTHGGFDNDLATVNDILKSVVGGTPERPFTEEDLEY